MRTPPFRLIPSILKLGALFLLWPSAMVIAQIAPQSAAAPPTQASWNGQPKYKPGEILVRFRPGTAQEKINLVHAANNAQQLKSWASVEGLHLVRVPAGVSIKDAIKLYKQHTEVLYAEPNYYLHALTTPNDPQFPQLWGLQ